MLKGRLNNIMRADMKAALLAHAYDGRTVALNDEGIELRNEAIKKLLLPAQIKAIQTLLPVIDNGNNRNRSTTTNWGGQVSVNCGGPKIDVGLMFPKDFYDEYRPIDGALPLLLCLGEQRLDLPADDDLAKRVQDWGDRCEAYRSERRVTEEQVGAALAAFQTVSQFQASWPDALPVVESILIEHLGRPAPSLPAVVITEMNAKLGLPPSNDEAEEKIAA